MAIFELLSQKNNVNHRVVNVMGVSKGTGGCSVRQLGKYEIAGHRLSKKPAVMPAFSFTIRICDYFSRLSMGANAAAKNFSIL